MNYRQIFLNRLTERFGHLGIEETKEATVIAKASHVAPMARLHKLYAPLNSKQIKNLEKDVKIEFPNYFKQFLGEMNGFNLFISTFGIDGLRHTQSRTAGLWQPFSILTPNITERIPDADASDLFIGGYSSDGSKLYIDTLNHKVIRCSKNSISPLFQWDDFDQMLFSELERLLNCFDDEGKLVVDKTLLVPNV